MTPLRVLTVIDAYRMGGAETLLAPLAVAATQAGVDMQFVAVASESLNDQKTLQILAEAGVRLRSLGIKRLLDPRAVPLLVREMRRSHCDIVHAHLDMAMTLATPAATLARKPVVATFHHVASPLSGRTAKRERVAVEAATRGDRTLFVSQASLDSFQRAYRPKGAPTSWQVVHNGIDLANYRRTPPVPSVRNTIGTSAGQVVVLPGALRDLKGIPVAIRAWPRVLARFPHAVLSLVGGGELEGQLRALVAELGLTDAVRFVGVRTDMPLVYAVADVVLLPSTNENLPTVLIEASACGRAVAASRVGGIPDIVLDGVTGLLFEADDEASLADTVCRLLGDADLRDRLGRAAEERAGTYFSSSAWIGNLVAVYESVLRTRGHR
jgi:glycosyltransferase involved in cell wall biosynthesis